MYKIISMTKYKGRMEVFVEKEDKYESYMLSENNGKATPLHEFPKAEYGDYERFWNIMSKWVENEFLKKPFEIDDKDFNYSYLLSSFDEAYEI